MRKGVTLILFFLLLKLSSGNNIELTNRDNAVIYHDLFKVSISNIERKNVIMQYYLYSSKKGRILSANSNVINLDNGLSVLDLKNFIAISSTEFDLKDSLSEDVYNINIQVFTYPSYQLLYSANEHVRIRNSDNLLSGKAKLVLTEIYSEGNYDQFSSSERLFYNNYIRNGISSKIDILNTPFNIQGGTLYQFDDRSFMLDRLSIELDYQKILERKKQKALDYIEDNDLNQLRDLYDSIKGLDQIIDFDKYETRSVVESFNNYNKSIEEIRKTDYSQYFDAYEDAKKKIPADKLDSLSKYSEYINVNNKNLTIDTSALFAQYGKLDENVINSLISELSGKEELIPFLKKFNTKQKRAELKKVHDRYSYANEQVSQYKEKYNFLSDDKLKDYNALRDKDDLRKLVNQSKDATFLNKLSGKKTFDIADFKEIKIGFFYPNHENLNNNIQTPLLGYSIIYNKTPWILSSYFGTSKVLSPTINKFYREVFRKTGAYQGEIGIGIGDLNKRAVLLNYTIVNRTDSISGSNKNSHIVGVKSKLNCENNRCVLEMRYDYFANNTQKNIYKNSSLSFNGSYKILKTLSLDQIIYYKGSDFFNPSLFLYTDYEVVRVNHLLSGSFRKFLKTYTLQHYFETLKSKESAFKNHLLAGSMLLDLSNQTSLLMNASAGYSNYGISENADDALNYSLSASFLKKLQMKKNVLDLKVLASMQQSMMYDYSREYYEPVVVDHHLFKKSFSYMLNVTGQISFKKINYTQSILFNKSEIDNRTFYDVYSSSIVGLNIKNSTLQLSSNVGYSIKDEFLYSFRTFFLISIIKNIKINTMLEYGKQRFFWPDVHYERGFLGNVSLYITM